MGPHWALFTHAAAPARRSRAPLAAEPRGAQWHSLGPEDRRSLGRLARPLSVVPDLPPRFQHWVRAGLLRSILEILAQALHDEGYLDLQEAFIDGSFAPAKRGGACVGKTKRGKGSKIMAIADRQGRPVAVHVERAGRTRTQRTQDGRPLRRYQRRWKIERLFAWVPELSTARRAL
jgi:hypothetical protein